MGNNACMTPTSDLSHVAGKAFASRASAVEADREASTASRNPRKPCASVSLPVYGVIG